MAPYLEVDMTLHVLSLALEYIVVLRPLCALIERRDRALGQQLRRSGSSVPLNIGEAEYSDPGNRRARLFTAAGSANESRVTLKVAIGWGHVEAERAAAALAIADRLMAMLYRLLHGR